MISSVRDLPSAIPKPNAQFSLPHACVPPFLGFRFTLLNDYHLPQPFSLSNSTSKLANSQSQNHSQPVNQNQLTYIVVFGYPPDKYSLTVEYFRSLGASTEPEPNTEIVNAFRIGFRDPGEAMHAVRRNGEVLGGTWMVGVKWAVRSSASSSVGCADSERCIKDSNQDLALSRTPDFMASGSQMQTSQFQPQMETNFNPNPNAMVVDSAAAVGTPIKLAPSVAAFRKAPAPAPQKPAPALVPVNIINPQQSPAKGVLGQVGDLLFGW
jgi:nuclear pore complex protein Nup53